MMGDDGAGPLLAEMCLGIQPDIVGFYYPMTQPVKEAVARVYQQLADWQGQGGFARLEAADD